MRVQLSRAHQVDILLCDEAERGELCALAEGGGGRPGSDHGPLSLGGGRGSRAALEAVILHLGQGADGGEARVVVASAGAVAAGRLHALQIGAAELGEVAGV